jgi:hypothetical protein
MSNIPRYEGSGQLPGASFGSGAPPSVMTAVRLMYAGAVLSAISMVVGLATTSGLRAAIQKAGPKLSAAQVTTTLHVTEAFTVVFGLIGIGLWIWMAIANQKGLNWARITGTVFFGLETIGLILSLARHEPALSIVVAVVIWAVGLGAVIFLWQSASSAYFKAPRYLS